MGKNRKPNAAPTTHGTSELLSPNTRKPSDPKTIPPASDNQSEAPWRSQSRHQRRTDYTSSSGRRSNNPVYRFVTGPDKNHRRQKRHNHHPEELQSRESERQDQQSPMPGQEPEASQRLLPRCGAITAFGSRVSRERYQQKDPNCQAERDDIDHQDGGYPELTQQHTRECGSQHARTRAGQ